MTTPPGSPDSQGQPDYGQSGTPNYGQQDQGSGQFSTPSYGQPDQNYGQSSTPSYGQPDQNYGQSSTPSYGQPDQNYGAATGANYGQQSSGYSPQEVPAAGGYGAADQNAYGQQAAYGGNAAAYGAPAYGGSPDARPGTVTAAAILTWVGAALTILGGLILVLVGGLPFEELMNDPEVQSADVNTEELELITQLARGFGWGALALGIALVVLGVFAFRRANWARWVLIVLAGLHTLAILASLLAGGWPLILNGLWTGGIIALLLVRPSAQWYANKNSGAPRY